MARKPLILELPPSVNHMYVNIKLANRLTKVLSNSSKIWFNNASSIIHAWRIIHDWKPIDKKLIINIWFYYPDNRKRDTHNGLKILMDVLEKSGIITDDRYAIPRIMNYEIDKKNPRIEIEFEELKE